MGIILERKYSLLIESGMVLMISRSIVSQLDPQTNSVFANKTLLEHNLVHSFAIIYGSFVLQGQGVLTETAWTAKPKIFTVMPLKKC